jgi:hypothetical protein
MALITWLGGNQARANRLLFVKHLEQQQQYQLMHDQRFWARLYGGHSKIANYLYIIR